MNRTNPSKAPATAVQVRQNPPPSIRKEEASASAKRYETIQKILDDLVLVGTEYDVITKEDSSRLLKKEIDHRALDVLCDLLVESEGPWHAWKLAKESLVELDVKVNDAAVTKVWQSKLKGVVINAVSRIRKLKN